MNKGYRTSKELLIHTVLMWAWALRVIHKLVTSQAKVIGKLLKCYLHHIKKRLKCHNYFFLKPDK